MPGIRARELVDVSRGARITAAMIGPKDFSPLIANTGTVALPLPRTN
jgi:hypothetical protein